MGSTWGQENKLGQDSSDLVLNIEIPTSQSHTSPNNHQHQTYNPQNLNLFMSLTKYFNEITYLKISKGGNGAPTISICRKRISNLFF